MSSQFYSGVGGTASVGTPPVELPITDWEVRPTAQITRFRNSKSGPYDLVEANYLNATVTVTVEYDFNNNPFQAPASIQIGMELSNVQLFLHRSNTGSLDGAAWSFPSLIVTGTPQTLRLTGQNIAVSFSCVSNGAFSYPS
ncbi:MAG TPA: hypothetical protein VL992_03920 [Tepidisphaeraceae bacterium]|nr:hypothetical protein [Tepidisphaeraceae bacterium]